MEFKVCRFTSVVLESVNHHQASCLACGTCGGLSCRSKPLEVMDRKLQIVVEVRSVSLQIQKFNL